MTDPCTAYEERAAILEHHAGMGLTREQAETLARRQIDAAERRERERGMQMELGGW